ncbi:MAG: FUSC family protein, partial [Nostocoides sp.]
MDTAPLLTARWRQGLIARGRTTAREEIRDARDRLIGSDPGLSRLRQGIRAAVAVATTAAVQYAVARLTGVSGPTLLLHVMLGCVLAMNSATIIRETRRTTIIGTTAGTPVAAALSATVAVLAAPIHVLSMAAFVGVSFFAVWVRRFGPRWFTWGFIAWQAYFFSMFLKPPVSALPGLLLAVLVSSVWVCILLVTVLYDEPEARLRRTVDSLRARARAVVSASLEVLDHPASDAPVKALRRDLIRTSAVALLFDGQLSEQRALPPGVAPGTLRKWLVDLEIGVDEVAGAAVDIAEAVERGGPGAPAPETLDALRPALRALGWGELEEARKAFATLGQHPHGSLPVVRRLTNAGVLLLDTVSDWRSGRVLQAARDAGNPGSDPHHQYDGDDQTTPEAEYGFEPVVRLSGGNLPGSVAMATAAVAGGDTSHWWSPGRLRFTTRQAIQAAVAAAIAMAAGQLISPQRFYWAALAAFITFTGASTTAETFRRGMARTVGTLLGLVAAIALAQVTAGRDTLTFVALIASIFLAFYVQAISNAAMVFFITLMLGQLYALLHTFTDDLLFVRLAETAAGAFAGIIVSFVILPAPAGDTLVAARQNLMTHLADLLDDLGRVLAGEPAQGDLYTAVVQVDEAARQVAMAQQVSIRPRFVDADASARQHRVAVLGACAAATRSLTRAVLGAPSALPDTPSAVCRVLAGEARRLADVPNLRDQRPAAADRPGLAEQVAGLLEAADGIPLLLT